MKQKKKAKQVKDLRRKRRKAIEQTGTTVLVFFLYMYKTSLSI